MLSTFSRLGEGFYSCALCKKHNRSIYQPQIDALGKYIQLRPPWHADFNRRGACAARPKGKYSRGRMALAPIRARRIFPATGHKMAVPPFSLKPAAFPFTTQVLCFFLDSRKKRNPSFPSSPPSFLHLHRHKRPAAQAIQPAKPHRQAGDLAQGAGVPAQLIAVHRRQLLGRAAVGLVIHQHPRAVFKEA